MLFKFCVDRQAAIKGGFNQCGEVSLDINVSALSQLELFKWNAARKRREIHKHQAAQRLAAKVANDQAAETNGKYHA